MIFHSRRSALLISLGAITALAAIACGSDNPPVTIPTQAPAPTSAPEAAATPIPVTEVPPTAPPAATAAPVPDATAAPSLTSPPSTGDAADQVSLSSENFDGLVEEVGVGTKPAIALDQDGNPNIAFMFESQDGFVKASERVDGVWIESLITEGYFYGPLDIDINPDGAAVVAWHNHQATQFAPNLGDVEIAVKTPGGWARRTLQNQGHDGWDTRLIIDDDGVKHIGAIDPKEFDGDGVEYYRVEPGGDIIIDQVGSGNLTYKFAVSIAIDSAGIPYLTNYDQDTNDLILAIRDGSNWILETVDAEGDAGQFAELVIDGDDRIHISYVTQIGPDAATVKYATRLVSANEWEMRDVDALTQIFYGFEGAREITAIDVDSEGNPWIVYTDASIMKLAVWEGSAWQIDSVSIATDRGVAFGQLVTMELDADDVPHIATFEVTDVGPLNGNILYFRGTAR